MHLFFDTVWKLHPGEIPEKPPLYFTHYMLNGKNYQTGQGAWAAYNEAIAAIKQNALTVENPEILEGVFDVYKIINNISEGEFHEWPGGYETKEIKDGEIRITAGGHPFLGSKTVAILTLLEEKKNTMENFKKFDLNEPHETTASGSVAAPKEERVCPKCGSGKVIIFTSDDDLCQSCGATFPCVLNGPFELDSLRQQLEQKTIALDSYYKLAAEVAPLKEALKELLPLAQWGYDLLVPFDKKGMGREWPAIIERARKLILK